MSFNKGVIKIVRNKKKMTNLFMILICVVQITDFI